MHRFEGGLMAVSNELKELIEILVCPEAKWPLWYLDDEAVLCNPRLRRTYPVRDGIPVLLVGEATGVDEAEHERLAALHEERGLTTGAPGEAR